MFDTFEPILNEEQSVEQYHTHGEAFESDHVLFRANDGRIYLLVDEGWVSDNLVFWREEEVDIVPPPYVPVRGATGIRFNYERD